MEFSELKIELKKFVFQELRSEEEKYFEAVVTKAELEKLSPLLEKFLGKPVTSQDALPPKVQAMIKRLGGVMAGQSLYLNMQGEQTIFAMLWPWGGGNPITIKTGVE